ncbi:hypothetical protein GN956_G18952 [Arapaima gigas]
MKESVALVKCQRTKRQDGGRDEEGSGLRQSGCKSARTRGKGLERGMKGDVTLFCSTLLSHPSTLGMGAIRGSSDTDGSVRQSVQQKGKQAANRTERWTQMT